MCLGQRQVVGLLVLEELRLAHFPGLDESRAQAGAGMAALILTTIAECSAESC